MVPQGELPGEKWLTRTTGKVICGIVLLIVLVAVGFAAAGTICMVRASKTAPKDETVMIVLGCGVMATDQA